MPNISTALKGRCLFKNVHYVRHYRYPDNELTKNSFDLNIDSCSKTERVGQVMFENGFEFSATILS